MEPGGFQHIFLGIYHHPAVGIPGVTSHPVAATWTNEATAFASSYAARSALWLIRLP